MTLSNRNYKQVQQQDDSFDAAVIVGRPVEKVVNNSDSSPAAPAASCWNEIRCAGCIGGMAGCSTSGGCWVSIICATGCMHCAKNHEGMGGDIARACGSLGVQANVMVRDLEDEHKLLQKSKQLGMATLNRAKQLND